MKKLRGSLRAKTIAVILLCLLALACAGSAVAASYLYGEGVYEFGYESTAREMVGQLGAQYSQSVGENYLQGFHTDVYQNKGFRFSVLSMDGDLLDTDYAGEEILWEDTVRVTLPYSLWTEPIPVVTPMPTPQTDDDVPQPEEAASSETLPTQRFILVDDMTGEEHVFTDRADVEQWEQEHSVQVHGYVLRMIPAGSPFAQRLRVFDMLYACRDAYIWVAAASLLLGLGLFVFLMSAAGHRDETDTITPSFVDKTPWDVLTLLILAGIVSLCFAIGSAISFNIPSLALCACAFLLAGLLFLLWCMSTATRLKLGGILKSCVIYRLLRLVWQGVKAVGRALGKLPLVWKWAAGVAALALIDGLWRGISEGDGSMMFFGWIFFWLLVGLATCYAVLAFRRLRLGARQIAQGDESATVDTRRLIGDFKAHAEDLNNIRAGLSRAVDERMKSERFKTELITNVSHDIKTPLTSIVSYVDLLSNEELENDKASEYIEVLQRQSARLKKLIDDLMEASKASTGNLPVTLTRCELGVLLEQAQGEYAERLEKAGLTLVAEKPEEPVAVMADGRHLWRIFDNLLSNICKYAQSGTRVYLTLTREGAQAAVTFRNISREPIRLDGAELTERFVRGDSSRSTEGSGLGLAIAQSLAELQGAQMTVTVDGDLFKVTLTFPAAE